MTIEMEMNDEIEGWKIIHLPPIPGPHFGWHKRTEEFEEESERSSNEPRLSPQLLAAGCI